VHRHDELRLEGRGDAGLTPYRLIVFAKKFYPIKRRKHVTEIALQEYAFMAWTPHQHYPEARLPSAGSFLFPGMHAARAEAMNYLTRPDVKQVSVRTDQDREVYRYFRHADGRVTGYGAEGWQ
jgi:hypothetical protein